MSSSSAPITFPSWMDGLVQVQEDGYLKLTIHNDSDDANINNLALLNSTENLLRILNPAPTPVVVASDPPVLRKTESPNDVAGQIENEIRTKTESEEALKLSEQEDDDSSYNHFVRIQNLMNSMQAALEDIQRMKQREPKVDKKKGRWSRDVQRIRSLEHRQSRLQEQLSDQQNQQEQATLSEQRRSEKLLSEDQDDIGIDIDDSNVEDNKSPQALHDPLIRWVLTLNSIRALFPTILPILNHERRNDVKLKICSYKLAVSAQGSHVVSKQCWLIGQHVFDVTSQKLCKKLHQDMCGILESFLRDPQVVSEVMASKAVDDRIQSTFWTTQWLEWVSREMTIRPVVHPLRGLAEHSTFSFQSMSEFAQQCDQEFITAPLALMGHQQGGSSDVQERYLAAISTLHTKLNELLTSRFRGARLSLYGSCMSNLSLGQSSDVDLSLYIPLAETNQRDFDEGRITASKYEKQMKSLVFQVCRRLETVRNSFRDMQPVARARVPVVSGCFLPAENPHSPDGSIRFDICLMNDIAVANSSLLHQYSLVDSRARALMLIVKKWAQDHEINSAKNRCISSYAWMNMVIFYLQSIGMLPNLQCPHLIEAVGLEPDPYWHSINSLETSFLKWSDVESSGVWKSSLEQEVPVTALLYGFFRFYACDFPWSTYCISIRTGGTNLSVKSVFRNTTLDFFCIEDPFETYDSYYPHDLGSPASESGQKKILDLLRDAESYLRNVLATATVDKEIAGLWQRPCHAIPVTEPEIEGTNQRKQRNRQQGRNGRASNEPRDRERPPSKNGQVAKVQTPNQESKQSQTNHVDPRHSQRHDGAEARSSGNVHSSRGMNEQRKGQPRNNGRNEAAQNHAKHRPSLENRGSRAEGIDRDTEQHSQHVGDVDQPSGEKMVCEGQVKVSEGDQSIVNGFSKSHPTQRTISSCPRDDFRRQRPGGRNSNQNGRYGHRQRNTRPRGQHFASNGDRDAEGRANETETHQTSSTQS